MSDREVLAVALAYFDEDEPGTELVERIARVVVYPETVVAVLDALNSQSSGETP